MDTTWKLLAALVLSCAVVCLAEQVGFDACPQLRADQPQNCTVHNVRVTPCKDTKRCAIRKGRTASIEFDFTPGSGATNLTSMAYWHTGDRDLPFTGMNKDACQFTNCPSSSGVQQTYSYNLTISKAYPAREYDVVWKLSPKEDSDFECCFLVRIKITR